MADRILRIIDANPQPYIQALNRSSTETEKFGRNTDRALGSLGSRIDGLAAGMGRFSSILGAVGIGFGVSAVVGSLKELIEQGAELNRLSTQFETSAGELDKLRQIAEQSGGDLETAADALFELNLAVQDAERSSNNRAANAFRDLNISLDEFKRLDPVRQLEAVAKRLFELESSSKRSAVAAGLLGDDIAQRLLPALERLANDGLQDVVATMDDDFAKAADRLDKNLDTIGNAFNRLWVNTLTPFAEFFADLIDTMDTSIKRTEEGLIDQIDRLNSAIAGLNRLSYLTPKQEQELETLQKRLEAAEEALRKLQSMPPRTTPGAGAGTGAGTGDTGGGRTTPKRPTAAERDLERRLGGLKDLEQEFMDQESVRVFEANRPETEQFDKCFEEDERRRKLELEEEALQGLNREFQNITNSATRLSFVIDGLASGTLEWHQALGPIFNIVVDIAEALGNIDFENINLGGLLGGGGSSGESGFGFLRSLGGIASSIGGFLGFAEGGVVPGPIGAPVLATVHGGERIFPPDQIPNLSSIGDVMRGIQPSNPNIANRIEPGGGPAPADVSVAINGNLIDPRTFKSTSDEIIEIVVNGVKHSVPLRDAIKDGNAGGGGF